MLLRRVFFSFWLQVWHVDMIKLNRFYTGMPHADTALQSVVLSWKYNYWILNYGFNMNRDIDFFRICHICQVNGLFYQMRIAHLCFIWLFTCILTNLFSKSRSFRLTSIASLVIHVQSCALVVLLKHLTHVSEVIKWAPAFPPKQILKTWKSAIFPHPTFPFLWHEAQ